MNRRQFVGGSILAAGGLVASNKLFPKNNLTIKSSGKNNNSIDLEILCDNPDAAYDSLSSFLKLLKISNVKIEEHQLAGNYIGDIVFIYKRSISGARGLWSGGCQPDLFRKECKGS